jgi:hypothetical protein
MGVGQLSGIAAVMGLSRFMTSPPAAVSHGRPAVVNGKNPSVDEAGVVRHHVRAAVEPARRLGDLRRPAHPAIISEADYIAA